MKYYTYGLRFYDSYDDTVEKKYGIVAANSYGDAITKVIKVYGEDDVDDVKISEMTNDECVEILTEDEDGTIDWGWDAANAFVSSIPSNPFDKEPQNPSEEDDEDDREFDFDEEYYDDEEEDELQNLVGVSECEDNEEGSVCDECEGCKFDDLTFYTKDEEDNKPSTPSELDSFLWDKEKGYWKKETKDDNSHKQEVYYSSNPKDTPVDIKNRISLYNEKMDEIQKQTNEAYKALIESLRRSYNRSGIAEGI